jgi:Na+/pantothenate symporter
MEILGTHFRTIVGTGLSSGLVIFLVFIGGFSSVVLTDATTSLIFFTSVFFGSFFFFSPSFFLG